MTNSGRESVAIAATRLVKQHEQGQLCLTWVVEASSALKAAADLLAIEPVNELELAEMRESIARLTAVYQVADARIKKMRELLNSMNDT